MTTTYYASVNDMDTVAKDVAHAGTSGTAGDNIELRMGNGTFVPTHRQVLNALQILERWIIQKGLDGLGANLPPNSG
jgi:hypothetical protein